jgi:hypothetical protein
VTVLLSITLTLTAMYAVTLIFDRTIPPSPPIISLNRAADAVSQLGSRRFSPISFCTGRSASITKRM